MITNYYGSVLKGSANLQTSVAEQEIIATDDRFTDFSLLNNQDCHISINGGDYIFVRANQGLELYVVNSIKIQEAAITFNWIGTKL